jgi:3-oxoacyl-[acyl-carrier protein] reductase
VGAVSYTRDAAALRVLDFDAIAVGDRAEIRHRVTQADVDAFAALTGDFNPLHVDAAFAQRTLFRRPVVHGMLSASFISTMIGTVLPGSGALWTSQTLDFVAPAFVGDLLTVAATVEQKSVAARSLTLRTVVTNQHGKEVVAGKAQVKVLDVRGEERPITTPERPHVVLVTGAGRGIGAAIASTLARAGHAVVINYRRSAAEAEALAADLSAAGARVFAHAADVADEQAVRAMFAEAEARFGSVDDVVHCAAPLPVPTSFEALGWEAFESQIGTQLKGAFNLAKAALPGMVERRNGSLLFIGSVFADGVPPVQQSPYVVTKAALVSFARTLAVEYGPKGVRVNVVAPGMTETDMISALPDKVKMLTKMQTPLRRLGDPQDVADAAEFLVSARARHITGETIRVGGGITMS